MRTKKCVRIEIRKEIKEMNLLLLFVEIIVYFSILLLMNKFFKKEGVFVWIAIASILANIQVCKTIDLVGLSNACGNVLFASVFLATDILNELYGKKSAKKGVVIGAVGVIISIIITQLTLLFTPNEFDFVNDSMKILFEFNLRVSLSSLLMYVVANYIDVILYAKLKKLKLWQKNNICTILCNSLENFGFAFLAFGGVMSVKEILIMSLIGSVIETIIALFDTPFLYIARKMK